MIKHTEEFKQEAVRVASDLEIAKSTLGKWLAQYRPFGLLAALQVDLARENERLRLENRELKEERDILNNCRQQGPPVCGRNASWYGSVRSVAADSLLVA